MGAMCYEMAVSLPTECICPICGNEIIVNYYGYRTLTNIKKIVDPSGIIRTCNHSPKKIGHIFNEDIITDKDYWNRFAKRDYIPNTCVMCNEVNKCDCGCRETANIVYKDFYALDACLNERVI